ncbi:hypothetical protein EJ06DRAFT_534537 [Trichodelitschia bisporula]|uniref:Uncharacterized protein n=1 Tax=Trichodelitschia bisporula TaxID=703511 RepID=A0A6G1HIG7_9PEZI|nr:hypothetical protein EJ06DRAFT_534537 [Trichodelitschia bisporula]
MFDQLTEVLLEARTIITEWDERVYDGSTPLSADKGRELLDELHTIFTDFFEDFRKNDQSEGIDRRNHRSEMLTLLEAIIERSVCFSDVLKKGLETDCATDLLRARTARAFWDAIFRLEEDVEKDKKTRLQKVL